MIRVLAVFCLLLAAPALAQPHSVREATATRIDIVFEDYDKVPEIPSAVYWTIHDRVSGIVLLAEQSNLTPASSQCTKPNVDPAPGCVRFNIAASAMPIVGRCQSAASNRRYCLVNGDCANGDTCAKPNEAFQDHVMTVRWTSPGGDTSRDRLVLKTLNLEFQ